MEYKDCYVAFIDILGFNEFVNKNTCENVHTALSYLEVEAASTQYLVKAIDEIGMENINVLCISDSVIISVEKKAHALDTIACLCAAFQLALFLQTGLMMRGGISSGDFYYEQSQWTGNPVLFGKAYNKAVDMEKNMAKYPRVIVDTDTINATEIEQCSYLKMDSKGNLYFVDFMKLRENAPVDGGYRMQLVHAANVILSQDTSKDSVREKVDWTKEYITKSLNLDIFSKDYLSQYEIDRTPINLKVVFKGE